MLLKKKIKNHTSKKKESPKKRKKNKFNWVRTSQKETKSFKPEEEEEGERESERAREVLVLGKGARLSRQTTMVGLFVFSEKGCSIYTR